MFILIAIIVLAILTVIGALTKTKEVSFGHALIILALLIIAYQGSP